MLIRHDAKIRVTTTFPICPSNTHRHKKCREVKEMTPSQLQGHLLVLGALYNVSGYYNPARPTVTMKVNPKDILGDGKLCSCKDCEESDANS